MQRISWELNRLGSATLARLGFELLVEFKFAVRLGDARFFAVGGLQLIVHVVRLWLATSKIARQGPS